MNAKREPAVSLLVIQLEALEAGDCICYSRSPWQNPEPHGHSLLV